MDGADSFQHSLEEQLRYMDMLPSTELPVVSATVARGDESVQATLEHAKFGASVSKNHTDSYTDSCCAAPVLDSHTGRVLAPHPSSGHGGSTMLDAAGPMNSATGGLGPKDVEDDSSYRMMGDPDSIYGFELDHTMLEQVESDLMHLPRSFHWEEPAAANQNVTAPSSAPVSAPGSWSLFSSCDSDGGSSIGSETGYSSASDDSSVSGSGSCSGSIAGTSRTGRGGRGAKRAGRRSSAPDALVDLGPAATTNFKKENHNRAERERTRKINGIDHCPTAHTCMCCGVESRFCVHPSIITMMRCPHATAYIYELRDITRCGDGDKVSILQTAVDTVKAALSQKQNHQHSVNNPPAISPLCDGARKPRSCHIVHITTSDTRHRLRLAKN
eukprot:SAG31_NODE_353_length_17229_cov_8.702160_9_plen_386_part_00